MGLKDFFRKRKVRKREISADEQYLDALEIIKESADVYLELLAIAKQNKDSEATTRLTAKLNSEFQFFIKNWDGEIKVIHTVISNCSVNPDVKRLKLD